MLRWFRKNARPPEWVSRQLTHGWFTIDLPPAWEMTADDMFTTFDDPAGAASVGVVIALRSGMSLDDFAAVCFIKEPPLEPMGEAQSFLGDGWTEGAVRDFVDTSAPEPMGSIERVVCVRAADIYAKVTFYAGDVWLRGSDYARIVRSIRLVGMRVVAGP